MKDTVVYRIDKENPDMKIINECSKAIREGRVVCFPTETVYGVGTNAFDVKAVSDIFYAKKRPYNKPLLCHISSLRQAEEISYLTEDARKLINAFTPGPLTVIVRKKDCIPDIITAGGDMVGLRFPSNRVFILLAKAAGCPIAATSANISGSISAKCGEQVIEELFGRVDIIVDAGNTEYGIESTIVSLADKPKIIRQGAVSAEEIDKVLML